MEKNLAIVLDKTKCKNCGAVVEILEVTGSGSRIRYAPCKNCGCPNVIHSEKWERGPAEVDLTSDAEIIQYIRDLLNLSDLLEKGLDAELLSFIKQLRKAGFSKNRIHRFVTSAGYGTRYEDSVNVFGDRIVPRPIKTRTKRVRKGIK